MIRSLKSIVRVGTGTYEVVLEDATGGLPRRFVLKVDDRDIQLLTWGDDFSEYMMQNMGPAKAMFEAVIAFHRAQSLVLAC